MGPSLQTGQPVGHVGYTSLPPMPWLWPPSTQKEQGNAVHIRVRMVPLNFKSQLHFSFHEQGGNICLDIVASSQCHERMYYCLTGHARAAWNADLSHPIQLTTMASGNHCLCSFCLQAKTA